MPEVTSCPSCARQLRVPDTLLGKAVKCPACGTSFTAGGSATIPTHQPPPPPPAHYEAPPRTGGYEEPPPPDEPEDQEYEDSPRRSRRRRRRSRGSRAPHRGGLILALGIIGLVMIFVCGLLTLPLCLPAWLMGNRDLREMENGHMDSDGEGITQAGRICGLIGTILGGLVYVFVCLYLMLMFVVFAGQNVR